jgi:hypothetical protein
VLLQDVPPTAQVEAAAGEEDFDTVGAPAGGNTSPPLTVEVGVWKIDLATIEEESEWELIKIIPEGWTQPMPQIHNQGFPHELSKVA